MKIGIIGAGNIGSALAGHFCKRQHTVLIANSRGPETLSEVAEATGATPTAISEVAKGVNLLIITIPMKAVPSLPKDLLRELPARSPIIDTGNYYPLRDGLIDGIGAGMTESEWTSSILGRPVSVSSGCGWLPIEEYASQGITGYDPNCRFRKATHSPRNSERARGAHRG